MIITQYKVNTNLGFGSKLSSNSNETKDLKQHSIIHHKTN